MTTLADPSFTRELGAAYAAQVVAGHTPADLAAKLAAGQDFLAGLRSGLLAEAPAGHVLAAGPDATLALVAEFLESFEAALVDEKLWMSVEEAEDLAADRAAWNADYAANPSYAFTSDQIEARDRVAFARGADLGLSMAAVA